VEKGEPDDEHDHQELHEQPLSVIRVEQVAPGGEPVGSHVGTGRDQDHHRDPAGNQEAPAEGAEQRDALVLRDRAANGADRKGEHHHPAGPHGGADQVQGPN
jgi:hypothetical protein